VLYGAKDISTSCTVPPARGLREPSGSEPGQLTQTGQRDILHHMTYVKKTSKLWEVGCGWGQPLPVDSIKLPALFSHVGFNEQTLSSHKTRKNDIRNNYCFAPLFSLSSFSAMDGDGSVLHCNGHVSPIIT